MAQELQFTYECIGDYVVAVGVEELSKLDMLIQRGKANGVPGMHLLSADEMRKREPLINPGSAARYSPKPARWSTLSR